MISADYQHSCKNRHYGDESVIRDCCVASAIEAKELAAEFALTPDHPAARRFAGECRRLTNAEWRIVSAHKTDKLPRWSVCF